MSTQQAFQLIIAVVDDGHATPLIAAAKNAGAGGATMMRGRGSGIHETGRFLGIPIEPEKDVLLVLVQKSISDAVMDAIVNAGELNKPGKGIAFMLDVARVEGIVHLEEAPSSSGHA